MAAHAERSEALEREWWLRLVMVLQSPRDVFAALRDDSDEAAAARQEPMLAVIFLAGIAAVLSTSSAARLLDDHQYDGLLIAVWAFIAGAIYGVASYWFAGAALYFGVRSLGGESSYRRSRHLLGLAAAPLALSLLVVWPVRLAIYGEDLFRSGGSDRGFGDRVFEGIDAAVLLWTLALLLIGARIVHGWTWPRSIGTVVFAAAVLVAVGAVFALL